MVHTEFALHLVRSRGFQKNRRDAAIFSMHSFPTARRLFEGPGAHRGVNIAKHTGGTSVYYGAHQGVNIAQCAPQYPR